jgi:ubiquinone/menaquinone biosynthesis C-methylase UbiE
VNRKFSTHRYWKGAISASKLPTAYDESFFDLVTCIETLEHLLDEMIPSTLQELHRLLKPRGIVFLTTPYDENLSESYICCPFCNLEFHKVQHVRSFNRDSIQQLLREYGFNIIYCQNIDLFELQRNKWSNSHYIKKFAKGEINRILDIVYPLKSSDNKYKIPRCSAGENLCVLAEKV